MCVYDTLCKYDQVPCEQGAFAGEWSRLSHLNPLDAGFRPAAPGIENPVVTRSSDGEWWIAVYHVRPPLCPSLSLSLRAASMPAGCCPAPPLQRLTALPCPLQIYTGPTVGVSFSRDGIHWTPQQGDLRLGDSYCGDTVTTACGLVPEPQKGQALLLPLPLSLTLSVCFSVSGSVSLSGTCLTLCLSGKGVYSLLYTASGKCSAGSCDHENVCRAYLINEAEQ